MSGLGDSMYKCYVRYTGLYVQSVMSGTRDSIYRVLCLVPGTLCKECYVRYTGLYVQSVMSGTRDSMYKCYVRYTKNLA